MFRPVRTLILIFVAFVAGILFERSAQTDRCLERGGQMDEGICYGGRV